MTKTVLILHDIRSILNVGSIFRTAEAVSISKIYLTGYTPAPVDRFGRERNDLKKTALGAEKMVVWEQKKDIVDLIKQLKSEGFRIIALEQSENSVDYKEIKPSEKDVIILGNEPEGINKEILKECDVIAEIPMLGKKESLNVSVAAGVFLYRFLGI